LLDKKVGLKYQINKIFFILYYVFWEIVMRLTRAGEYAVRCVLYLAAQRQGAVCNRKEIAKAMDIPGQFLGKIAQQLAHAGLIEVVQGSKGGLRLVFAPDKISLLDVVEAVIGEIFLNDCILRQDSCDRSNACAAHFVWEKARNQLRATLSEATFARLLKEDRCFNRFEIQKNISDQA
jgi:Rrf2 family iron-sulfur cluster assembly transcriptional regulator